MTRRITDRERLDWLNKNRPCVNWWSPGGEAVVGTSEGKTLRAAIDAAIRAERRRRAKK